ncbi:MAG: DNA-directed DNA polymerase I [Thermoprotei archaeon]|nr:MAG: DNA-directed DNA polymerase I [Thermoprotei archaeon]
MKGVNKNTNNKTSEVYGEEVEESTIVRNIYTAEAPRDAGPLLLLSVVYSGDVGKALLKLYDPSAGKIVYWYDNTGHKPYCLTDVPPEELASNYTRILEHRGFDHIEVVEKYDALLDKKVAMTKIVARDPLSIGGARDSIRNFLLRSWEAKIRYHLCYIYDRELIPGFFYKIEGGKLKPMSFPLKKDLKDLARKLYGHDELLFKESLTWLAIMNAPIPDIRRIALDIEVYSPTPNTIPNPSEALQKVIAVALSSSDGVHKVLLLERKDIKSEKIRKINSAEVVYFEDEKELIKTVFKIISTYPLVLTFNGDNFDLNYLYHRALKLGFRREEIPIVLARNFAMVIPGVHIDLYRFFENHAMRIYAFKNKYRDARTLDAIATALLGIGKIQLEKPITKLDYRELAEYCFRDADITLKLTTFGNNLFIKLLILLMRISKLPAEDLTRSGVSNWIKNMIYFEHRKRGYLIPEPEDIRKLKGQTTTKAIIKGKKYLGAIVIDPLPGIFFNVVVVDFASLYPSVVKKWNLSYETLNCPHEECKSNKVPGLPYWVCTKKRGLSSMIIGFLRDFRVEIYKPLSKDSRLSKEEKETYETIQLALKVFINASYGVFGADTFPLYCPPVAESTTALGRYAISNTIRKANEMGLVVLYGDTDSLFLWNPSSDKVSELLSWAHNELGIDLDIDKEYRYVAFSGRKKNYLGVLKDNSLDVKGLVGKKRHTPEFIKELFNEVSKTLTGVYTIEDLEKAKNTLREITRQSVLKLRRRKYPLDKLAFRVALTKELTEYTKTTPQHVKAARLLQKYGFHIEAGEIINFVKIKGSLNVKPVQLARIDEIDSEKYFSYIETTLRQVLEAIGVNFDEILGESQIDSFF